jgi:tRNA dimethylallyltransferase
MLREAAQLHKKGLSLKRLEMLGLECKFAALYLRKKISKQEFLYELAIATWQYAKRQKTWFQRNKDIFWINGMAASQKTLLGTLRKFLKK